MDERQPPKIYDDNHGALIERGHHTVPVSPLGFSPKKAPVKYRADRFCFHLFHGFLNTPPLRGTQPGANIGVLPGTDIGGRGCKLAVLDFDLDDAALRISEVLPLTPVNKRGQRGWSAFYQTKNDIPNEDFFTADGKLAVQILSKGKMTVIPPSIHPDTLEAYTWCNGPGSRTLYDTPASDLPMLPDDYRERIRALGYLQENRSNYKEKQAFDDTEPQSELAELNAIAIKNLAAWVPLLNIHKLRRRVGRTASYEGVAQWRDSTTGKKLEERELNLKISGVGIKDFGDGRGYSAIDLVMAARASGLGEAVAWLEEKLLPKKADIDWDALGTGGNTDEDNSAASDTQPEKEPESKSEQAKEKKRRINPMPLILPAEKDVPRRQFLYGKHYMRGTVSGTIGTGGTGKSTLGIIEGVGMEIGRDLFGSEKFRVPLRVWYHNAEETLEELIRRGVAICKYYNIAQGQLKDFYVTNGFEMPIKVASGGRDVKIDGALRKEIIEVITDLKIDVVIFDPLVAMHRVHEDFNSALDPVIRDAFGKIAHDANCSVDLCHHTRKKPAGQEGEYTAADSRGGGSFVDAVRGLRVLNTMSKGEAVNFDIREDDRFDYMKLSRGKANMVRRGIIGWYQFHPVEIDNGSAEEGIEGDTVAVLRRWDPPKDGDLVRAPTREDRVFLLGALQYGEYRYDSRSPNWFGFKIAERLDADKKDPKKMKVVAAILDDLIEDGTFAIVERKDEQRKLRPFVVPGVLSGLADAQ